MRRHRRDRTGEAAKRQERSATWTACGGIGVQERGKGRTILLAPRVAGLTRGVHLVGGFWNPDNSQSNRRKCFIINVRFRTPL
jgi:hypothetical protein